MPADIISLPKRLPFRILGVLSRLSHVALRVRPMRVSKDFLPTSSAVPAVNDTQIPKNRFKDLGGLKFSQIIC